MKNVKLPKPRMLKLSKSSDNSTSIEPTEDHSYTWIDYSSNDFGFFHKTPNGALKEVHDNYGGFKTLTPDVLIVKAIGWANKGSKKK